MASHTANTDIEDQFKSQNLPTKKTKNQQSVHPDIAKKIVADMIGLNLQERDTVDKMVHTLRRKYKILLSNAQLLSMYKTECNNNQDLTYESRYEKLLQSNQVRSNSGVNVVAVTLSPYPFTQADKSDKQSFSCQWNCKFCPSKPGFPRSYVDGEPGVDRGFQNNYDPVAQIQERLTTLKNTGHAADKLEIIVLGGTWASYPILYQYWFITSLYYGANTFSCEDETKREMLDLGQEIKLNERANSRIIGLTLETRPDCINAKELCKFRRMGVTRVQLGMQHINERVLERIDRRCKTQSVISAIKMLKDNCFKVDIHIMPDLPKPVLPGYNNSDIVFTHEDLEEYNTLKQKKILNNILEEENLRLDQIELKIKELRDMIDWEFNMFEEDKRMINTVVNSEHFQADQWKLYPLQVMPWSPLESESEIGLHKSYIENISKDRNELIEILLYAQQLAPKWIRINRVVRDIPIKYVKQGCDCSNLQQYLIDIMKKEGKTCKCIRCREVKNKKIDYENAKLCVTKYRASEGDEYFISFEESEIKGSTLYGFLRLRLSENSGMSDNGVVFNELKNTALIRELHVYGQTIAVNSSSTSSSSQHLGFGTRLLKKAEEIAFEYGYTKIAVISGVGVREYYRKRGYEDGEFFLLKDIGVSQAQLKKSTRVFSNFSFLFAIILMIFCAFMAFY
jgi:histone acetyltransferase (RNA polymerase elongator complex component)